MMLNILIAICSGYVVLLFAVAFMAERSARRGKGHWLRSSFIYTLSLSVYCTAWTFYGAVGYAARSGLEFLTIYLGPSLIMFGWWWVLRRLVRIGRTQRVTSIADLLSSRFGKSNLLAIIVTVLAVVGTTPYIALQLQSVTLSFEVFAIAGNETGWLPTQSSIALWVASGLAIFTILFGTRNLDVNERHHGVVMAIAVEALVKLFALLAVGAFVVWGIAGGIGETLSRIDASRLAEIPINEGRWTAITFLSAAAFICLPRMFQVLVVENENETHLRTASWAFPTYVLLMSLFVVPIAVIGLETLPEGANPDLFVLSLPLHFGNEGLAILSFLGGFSSATSMVIVASLALSTMVSNHIVMPLWLRLGAGGASVSGDVRKVILITRRSSIAAILFLGYLYFIMSGGGSALAAIGLISFTGVVQVLPALLGGLFWRGATRLGAISGVIVGFAIWLYTLFLPSFGQGVLLSSELLEFGPLGIMWLRPQSLFGLDGMDPLVHGIFWSLSLNTLAFMILSLVTFPSPIERLQGAQFVNVFDHSSNPKSWSGRFAPSEDLMVMTQRILGPKDAQNLFQEAAKKQGLSGYLPEPTPEFLSVLERELAGSVGAATAHAMIGQIVGGMSVSVRDLMAVADETAQMMEYSSRLEAQQEELSLTAGKLREANEKLTRMSHQKDAFLSQISHELRTPMTSILAFAEILRDEANQKDGQYATIIHEEAIRLTRLLDDLLDLSVLENGQVNLNISDVALPELVNRSIQTVLAGQAPNDFHVDVGVSTSLPTLRTDADRLGQVFINLVSNARKYCDAVNPSLRIVSYRTVDKIFLDFIDNGSGVPKEAQDMIFEKFSRIGEQKAGGAGLGLAICREIMHRLGGDIVYLPGQGGGAFRIIVPIS